MSEHATEESRREKGHVAILGAGPTGMEAALATHEHGYSFTIYEASPNVAGHVHSWRHVKLFTPWQMNMSERMRRALERQEVEIPPLDECPTGADLIDRLFKPLAELPEISSRLKLGTRVVSVGREGLLKHEEIGTVGRAQRPFRILVEGSDGRESLETADIVLDCSGNTVANALGGSGLPALGERRLDDRIDREVPTADAARALSGQSVVLVGGGHSAQTALEALVSVARENPATHIHWVLRSAAPAVIEDDPLKERRRLMSAASELAAKGADFLSVHERSTVDSIEETDGGRLSILLRNDNGREQIVADRILALTGKVGDHLLYRQLQVHECYATSGPMKLAAALLGASGGSGDCLAQTSLGPETLRSPEPGFFILGSKSYGRRNDYLMQVGRQQVDEIFELLD